MPPKARFTKDMIEDAAFTLAKQRGMEAVAAREVAKALNMTVTPIFSCFDSMADLKKTVYDRAKSGFQAHLRGCLDCRPALEAFALRWVQYGAENPNLYRLLMQQIDSPEAMQELLRDVEEPLMEEIMASFRVCRSEAQEMLLQMLIYCSGLCALGLQGVLSLSEEDVSRRVSGMLTGLAAAKQAKP